MLVDREFAGTTRFRVLRRVGSGGMGVVYEGFDTERRERVAIKTLNRVDALGIYGLKSEFRSLADVVHPNLITLHELFADEDHWFFTMEFVDGVSFLDFVRERQGFAMHDTVKVSERTHDSPAPTRRGRLEETRGFREAALRNTLRQLVFGVRAIHLAGKLHRDLKPSNVLVTSEGRVVILDFGLASDRVPAPEQTQNDTLVGTPSYMAPELVDGRGAQTAADWYSVGVMLYEALTGVLPHRGSIYELLAAKKTLPSRPSEITPNVPADLERLCMSLLAPQPEERATVELILEVVGGAGNSEPAPSRLLWRGAPFIGRSRELDILNEGFHRMLAGSTAAAIVSGSSGMGKTALIERFVSEATKQARVAVLWGRCYERERVPYKVFDGLIDSLTRYLRRLSDVEIAAALPRDVEALARMFPVLRHLDTIALTRGRVVLPSDPHELRSRAFAGLRELMMRLADATPLILIVDDLQWDDRDSAKLMEALLAPPSPPAVYVIGACREDELEDSASVRALDHAGRNGAVELVRVILPPLDASEVQRLAEHCSNRVPEAPECEAIARESRGNPYFVLEMLRDLETDRPLRAASEPNLDRALARRVASLPEASRRLLKTVAVAGHPLSRDLAMAASNVGEHSAEAERTLQAAKLLRTLGTGGRALTTYHDRVREAVVAWLTPEERRASHLALADALEAANSEDFDVLAEHLVQAEQASRAAVAVRAAADRATGSLAFDQAARLYTTALELHPESADDELKLKLAEALSNAGRAAEAARVFLEVADAAPPPQASSLRQRAAAEQLIAGEIDEGIEVLSDTLRRHGVTLPTSYIEAFQMAFDLYGRLLQRGFDYTPKAAEEVDPAALERLDLYWSAALGFSTVDYSLVQVLSLRHLLDALDVGEKRRILRGLAFLVFTHLSLSPHAEPILRALEIAGSLSTEVNDAYCHAWVSLARGFGEEFRGRVQLATCHLEAAEEILRERCCGVAREIGLASCTGGVPTLYFSGRFERLAERYPALMREAGARQDHFLETFLRVCSHMVFLPADDPDTAERETLAGIAGWKRRFDFPAWAGSCGLSLIDLYRGRVRAAWDRLAADWSRFEESGVILIPVFRCWSLAIRGAVAMGAALGREDHEELRADVARSAEELGGIDLPGTGALRSLLLASRASLDDAKEATLLFERAEREFSESGEYPAYEQCCRLQRGRLLGGSRGRELAERAEAALRDRGVRRPERFAQMYAPISLR